MQLRTFTGPDMTAALAEVKRALGPDAIVVATRHVRKPSLMRDGLVEVTAALEPDAVAPQQRRPVGARELSKYAAADMRADLRRDIDALRAELRDPAVPSMARDLNSIRDVLTYADIDPELAADIAEKVSPLDDERQALTTSIARELAAPGAASIEERGVIALVGPTGVGKTTSIAKLAAVASLVRQRRVALISTDTYRIGAGEQLAAYAELIGVPFTMAPDRAALDRALSDYAAADLVLIDTAGRGVRDGEHIARLNDLFAGTKAQIWLTLAATTRQRELKALCRAYEALPKQALVMTKLDEATQLGALLNAGFHTRLPLAYVTHGQRVPEDVVRPRPVALARALVEAAHAPDAPLDTFKLDLGSEVQSWT